MSTRRLCLRSLPTPVQEPGPASMVSWVWVFLNSTTGSRRKRVIAQMTNTIRSAAMQAVTMRRHEIRRVNQLCRRCCAQGGSRTITRLHLSLAQRDPTRCPSAPHTDRPTPGDHRPGRRSPTSTKGGSSMPTLLSSRVSVAKTHLGFERRRNQGFTRRLIIKRRLG